MQCIWLELTDIVHCFFIIQFHVCSSCVENQDDFDWCIEKGWINKQEMTEFVEAMSLFFPRFFRSSAFSVRKSFSQRFFLTKIVIQSDENIKIKHRIQFNLFIFLSNKKREHKPFLNWSKSKSIFMSGSKKSNDKDNKRNTSDAQRMKPPKEGRNNIEEKNC